MLLSNDEEQSTPSTEEPEEVSVKSAKTQLSGKKEETNIDANIKQFFPAIGERVDDQDKTFGELRITSVQLPEVKDMKQGQTYDLNIKVLCENNKIDQDTKYDDKIHESIATSDPYYKANLKIVSIKTASAKKEPEQPVEQPKGKAVRLDMGPAIEDKPGETGRIVD